ncbi:hypothetical protein EAF00_005122 [Botryotinia globosa]|nr:hypothetical protein EAF00_005122 [Botryotinia globosa]
MAQNNKLLPLGHICKWETLSPRTATAYSLVMSPQKESSLYMLWSVSALLSGFRWTLCLCGHSLSAPEKDLVVSYQADDEGCQLQISNTHIHVIFHKLCMESKTAEFETPQMQ